MNIQADINTDSEADTAMVNINWQYIILYESILIKGLSCVHTNNLGWLLGSLGFGLVGLNTLSRITSDLARSA